MLELQFRSTKLVGWDKIVERNRFFDSFTSKQIEKLAIQSGESPKTVFGYSYAGARYFETAKKLGYQTVMQQIDAGPKMFEIESTLCDRHPEFASKSPSPPATYWEEWTRQTNHADKIVVNSKWTSHALENIGIPKNKISQIPLCFPTSGAQPSKASLPAKFSKSRPLRLLFVGQVTLLKGIAELLHAMELLNNQPVTLTIVGPLHINIPRRLLNNPQIAIEGRVPRSECAKHYDRSDAFVFPSFSDGFGLVQLEAQHYGKPIIASKNCGEVVTHGTNGILLDTVSAESIANAIEILIKSPETIAHFAEQSHISPQFSLNTTTQQLLDVFDTNELS
ncbi:glycosyltransferase family 4 protein [Rhodopirellula sp. SWK7]|uniref:glycosyltransferase family 4 protein n=1 Tax=Rhodopirellula sp. SWK7 TaxID=595460 RepID=UPI00069410F4|nr:glycosyltransferase family 4 protein [Rhodopirellula sp. SWK7]